ncbi:MAG: SDR family NAD(P)-dependent oxidoreductase, partial [bacterium]|nr:SDR family NAD(P)-dependent oxidoreductase [bacterium]
AFLSGEEAPRAAQRAAPAVVRGERAGGEIAIVGMSARFAGASSVEEFWENLCGGVESIRRLSVEELEAAGVDPEIYRAPDYVPAAADLRDPDRFDAAFFGFNPREAEILDPQHRVLLECAWQALESAGYDPNRYPGRVGVFAGAGMSRYAMNVFGNPELVRSLGMAPLTLAVSQDFLAPRISYKLNLTGPSVGVQTACSTSLVAVHMAQQALVGGTCDMALAGGVTLLEHPPQGYRYLEGGIQSSDGHCRAFDAAAEGMVSSSGAGVVVLKRLADAVADGDRIHAVVKATAVNNDGAVKMGFTAPSEEGQAQVIRNALQAAAVEAETIGYVEAHGTATALGDPIEVAALTRVFDESTARRGFCALGSVKTNIGHADNAAGLAGLIKAALAVDRGLVPPSLGFERPNPAIDFAETPFYVPTELRKWEHGAGAPRRAGVSAFGIGGTNAHVIVEQAPATEPSGRSRPWQLLVLSAATATALEAVTARLAEHLEAATEKQSLADVAFTCQVGRRRLPHRRTLVVRGRRQALAALAAPADGEYVAEAVDDRNRRSVVFLCSGLGEQYPGMGRELYVGEPVFRAEVDRCCALLEPLLGLDLRAVLFPDQAPSGEPQEASGPDLRRLLGRRAEPESEGHRWLSATRLQHPAVFVIEVALARLLRSWGIVPRAMIGYSLGEYTAACLAGVFEFEDALTLVAERAELISTLPGGAMTAVALPEAEVPAYLGPELSLAASNAPAVSVLAGPEQAIARCEAKLAADGHVYQRLQTRHAFHSPMMEPIAAAFGERVRRLPLRPPEIPFLANVTGTWITAGEATDPDYWVRHLCRPVRFAEGLRELLRDPEPVLLEVGPGQALATAARQHPERPAGKVVLATLRDEREQHPDQAFLLRTLGQLWAAGLEIDWNGFYAGERRRRLALPTYPFERRRFWIEQPISARVAASAPEQKKELADWFYVPVWQPSALAAATTAAAATTTADEDRRWLLLADDCGLGAEMARQLTAAGCFAVTVRPGEGFARLGPASFTVRPAERSDYEALLGELRREGGIPRCWVHLWSVTGAAEPGGAADLGFYSLLSQMQALGGEGTGEPLRLAVVSDGTRATGRGEALWPEKAAVMGPSMVIPLEYPNVRSSHVDVTLDGTETLAGQLIADPRAGLPDPVAAPRDGGRRILGHEPLALAPVEETPELPHGAVVLILGGCGGLGLTFARYLAETFQARLVLTSRAPLADRAPRLRTLAELGAEVVVEQADVADEAAMRGVVERTRARFGTLDAVIHAAGVAGGGVIQLKPREVAAEVLRSKVQGMRVLEAVLADAPARAGHRSSCGCGHRAEYRRGVQITAGRVPGHVTPAAPPWARCWRWASSAGPHGDPGRGGEAREQAGAHAD